MDDINEQIREAEKDVRSARRRRDEAEELGDKVKLESAHDELTLAMKRAERFYEQRDRQEVSSAREVARVPDINSILGASHYIHFGDSRGHAVAVTSNRAVCALHGTYVDGTIVTLIDSHGTRRSANVVFQQFEENRVDIALLELSEVQIPFETFVPIATSAVRLLQDIYVFGITTDPGAGIDATTPVCDKCRVNVIQEGSLFRASYTGYDGLSGAGIVVVELVNNQFQLAGVHVGTHDDTVSPPAIKKKKGSVADADSTSASTESLARSIRGHTDYCLICEIQRVPRLVSFLNSDASMLPPI